MSDIIIICGNPEECPFKARCVRNTTTPTERQSWAYFHNPGEKCGHFMSEYPYRAERRDVA